MSVNIPKVYLEITADDGTYALTSEVNSVKITKPVTAAIGDFQIRVPHGSGSIFTRYHDANVFKNVDIWLGTGVTGSSKIFSGKIDSFKSEFDPKAGYLITFTGRDLGEALFRHQVTKDYFGYTSLYPSPRRGTTSGGYDVYCLESYTGSVTNTATLVTVGTAVADSLFRVKPYATINASFGTSLPGFFGTGSVTTVPFTATGSDYEVHLKFINASAFAHSGKMYAQLYVVDDTGSMTNPVALSSWYGGTTIDFPSTENFVVDDTISINLPYFAVENKYIYLQMVWKVTTAGADATAGLKVEYAQNSFLNIPNDTGLATNVVVDILSGSGINTGSNFPWNDTPITQSYNKKKAFDAIREIDDIVNWDSIVDVTGSLQAWTRRTHTNNGLLQTGSNILKFSHMKDVDAVANNIRVYGAQESKIPSDGDYWTEYLSGSEEGWSLVSGSLTEGKSVAALPARIGSKYLSGSTDDAVSKWLIFRHVISPSLDLSNNETAKLLFYTAGGTIWSDAASIHQVRLKRSGSDEKNYFYAQLKALTGDTTWTENSYDLGNKNVTGSVQPGDWVKEGNMNWADVNYIEFYLWYTGVTAGPTFYVDGLYFGPTRWSGSAINATSTGSYGNRPYIEESDYFHSNDECQSRADYLLARMKDPPNQYQILTTGSEGINPGDRIYLLLPSEGVSSQTYYDIIELTHTFTAPDGFVTELMLSDAEKIRDVTLLKSYGVLRSYGKKDVDDALRGNRIYY